VLLRQKKLVPDGIYHTPNQGSNSNNQEDLFPCKCNEEQTEKE